MGAFIVGMVIASFAALIAGALTDMGLWACLALWVSVVVVSQLLYVLTIALVVIGRGIKGRQDAANTESSRCRRPAPGLNGKK